LEQPSYVLNSVVKISVMFAKYFEYYTIILGAGGVFSWTRRILFCIIRLFILGFRNNFKEPVVLVTSCLTTIATV